MNKLDDWRRHIVKSSVSTLEVIRIINGLSLHFVIVVSEDGKLLGTVTDGDIRRGLLASKDINMSVTEVMNSEPFVVDSNFDVAKVRRICIKKDIFFVPVIDENRIVTAVISSADPSAGRTNEFPVVIMAGGLGSRLGELTKNCPKPMIRVGGKPILEILLEKLSNQGFREVFLCVNYLHEQIQDYFGDGEKLGLKIEYIVESSRMGTAGALSLLKGRLDKPFIVTNADIITDINFNNMIDYFITTKADAIVGVRTYEVEIPFGVIKAKEKKLIAIEEKPRIPYLVSAGMYVVTPKLIELIPSDVYLDMPNFLEKAVADKHSVNVFPIHENWIDVGRTSDLVLASKELE